MDDLHPVPTPRDVHPKPTPGLVAAFTQLAADATGLSRDDVVEHLVSVPVLDVPARQDAPNPTPRRRGVVVTLHPIDDADVWLSLDKLIPDGTRWERQHGELSVFDGPTEVAAFARGTWVKVAFAAPDTKGSAS